HRRPGECAESSHVCGWRWRFECVGGVLTIHLLGVAAAVDGVRCHSPGYADRRTWSLRSSRTRRTDEDHHHARAFGERCGIIWRGAIANDWEFVAAGFSSAREAGETPAWTAGGTPALRSILIISRQLSIVRPPALSGGEIRRDAHPTGASHSERA